MRAFLCLPALSGSGCILGNPVRVDRACSNASLRRSTSALLSVGLCLSVTLPSAAPTTPTRARPRSTRLNPSSCNRFSNRGDPSPRPATLGRSRLVPLPRHALLCCTVLAHVVGPGDPVLSIPTNSVPTHRFISLKTSRTYATPRRPSSTFF